MNNKKPALKKVFAGMLLTGAFALPAQAMELSDAVAQTLSTHPEILAQLREADARNRQVRGALGEFYPDVDLLAGFGFQERDPVNAALSQPGRTRNELERSEAQLNVRQTVFDGFERWNEYQNQKAREQSAVHQVKAVAERVSLDAIEAYLNLMKREALLKLAQETLDFHEGVFGRMEERFGSGVGSRADLDQISGRQALARTNFFNAQANLIDARTNFQNVVGSYPQEALEKPDSYRNHLPATVEEAVARAQQNHPTLQVANTEIEAVRFQYEQTKAAFYPEFSVDVERDLNKNIDGIEGQVDDLRVMLRMHYNLFNGRTDQARKQQFAHLVEKAKEIRNNASRDVEQEVRLAWVAYELIKEQIPALERYAKDSAATRTAYTDQYDLGRRTLLDLLNTENENISARQSLISAQYDLIFNEYRLFQSMGDLLYILGAKL